MRILVTGARGKVGAATVSALTDAGHAVTATDLSPPLFEAEREAIPYKQADLTDAGDAYAGVPRFVNISSETVPGYSFAERPFLPDYVPVDEEHPIRPQDPYATAKHFGEQLMDAAIRRSDLLTGISIRPSWVQWEGNYARNLGPAVR